MPAKKPTQPKDDNFDIYSVEVFKVNGEDWEPCDVPDFDTDHLVEGMERAERDRLKHPEWRYRVVHTTVVIIELK